MVAYTLCAGCMTGDHDHHAYWIQKPPEGVMGGWACGCKSAEECAGSGEKLLRSLFGDGAIDRAVGTPIPPAESQGAES